MRSTDHDPKPVDQDPSKDTMMFSPSSEDAEDEEEQHLISSPINYSQLLGNNESMS